MQFGGVRAVRNVNFTLAERELRCLIGPNGAGKSTFFKMVTGQLQPSQGVVLFRGRDISHAQAHEIARRGIGIKTQVPSVFDGLSVRENIWLSASRVQSLAGARPQSSTKCWSASASPPRRGGSSASLPTVNASGTNSALCFRPIRNSCCSTNPAAGMTHEEVLKTAELVREINRDKALTSMRRTRHAIHRMIASKVTVFNQGGVLVEDSVENILRNPVVRDIYLGKQAVA